jgi:hypothetical protein
LKKLFRTYGNRPLGTRTCSGLQYVGIGWRTSLAPQPAPEAFRNPCHLANRTSRRRRELSEPTGRRAMTLVGCRGDVDPYSSWTSRCEYWLIAEAHERVKSEICRQCSVCARLCTSVTCIPVPVCQPPTRVLHANWMSRALPSENLTSTHASSSQTPPRLPE